MPLWSTCKNRRQQLNSIQETENVELEKQESADIKYQQLKHRVNLSSLLTLISRNVINYVKDPFCASRLKYGMHFSVFYCLCKCSSNEVSDDTLVFSACICSITILSMRYTEWAIEGI